MCLYFKVKDFYIIFPSPHPKKKKIADRKNVVFDPFRLIHSHDVHAASIVLRTDIIWYRNNDGYIIGSVLTQRVTLEYNYASCPEKYCEMN